MVPGAELTAGQSLTTPGGAYRLTLQSDGNLVEYNSSGTALWASGTSGNTGDHLTMQGDGNLVLYSSSVGSAVGLGHQRELGGLPRPR